MYLTTEYVSLQGIISGLTLFVQSYARSVYNTLWIPCTISQSSVTFSAGWDVQEFSFSLESSSDDAASDIREKWLKLDLQVVPYLLWRRRGKAWREFWDLQSRKCFDYTVTLLSRRRMIFPVSRYTCSNTEGWLTRYLTLRRQNIRQHESTRAGW
jgi:hypothetical protein